MSLAPLPITSTISLPLSSEGLTATRTIRDQGQASAHVILAAAPDFAEMMEDFTSGASEPVDLGGKECCSAPEPQTILHDRLAAEEDLQADSTLSAIEETPVTAAFFETPVLAGKDALNADESDQRYAVTQKAELSGEPVKALPRHPNLAEKAGSETHLNEFSLAETIQQIPDGATVSTGPVGVASVIGGAPKVRDRVISLQEFTFVDGAARNGLHGMPHDGERPASHPVTVLVPSADGAYKGADRETPISSQTGTVLPQKPPLAAVADPTEAEGRLSLLQPSRESAAPPQTLAIAPQKVETALLQPPQMVEKTMAERDPAALPLPKNASAWHGADAKILGMRGAEPPGPASDPARPQAAPGTTAPMTAPTLTTSVPSTPSIAIDDLAWGAGPAENRAPPAQVERPAVNRLKTSFFGVTSTPKAQDRAPMRADLAQYPTTIVGGVGEGHLTDEMTEGLAPAAISPAPAVPRPDAAIPRADLPRHIAQQVADVAMRAADGPVDLHMNPEELGKVRISMAMAEGGITVTILAERPETLDLMRRHIDQLNQEFRQLGYGLISFSFGQHNQRQDNQQDNQSDSTPNQAASAKSDDQPGPILSDGGHGHKNGLDLRI